METANDKEKQAKEFLYERPLLVKYGDIKKITEGTSGSITDGSTSGNITDSVDPTD